MDTTPGTAAAYAAAAVVVVLAVARISGGDDPAPAAGERVAIRKPGGAGCDARRVYVHVAGAVRRPGLYRVPESSRVAAAVHRAGGTTRRADPTGLNLAARVADGQQVVVPMAGATEATAAAPGGAAAAAPVSLGSATVEQLDGIDGIGPALAARIVKYRQEHGGIRSVEDLRSVEGIGDKRLETLAKAVQP